MKKLMTKVDNFIKRFNWKDIALLKTCLFSMGAVVGTCVPERSKKSVRTGAGILFGLTYVLLMVKFIGMLVSKEKQ